MKGCGGLLPRRLRLDLCNAECPRPAPRTAPSARFRSLPAAKLEIVEGLRLAANAIEIGKDDGNVLYERREAGDFLLSRYAPDGAFARTLGLPDHIVPLATLPIGYPARKLGRPRRRPIAELTSRDRYGNAW